MTGFLLTYTKLFNGTEMEDRPRPLSLIQLLGEKDLSCADFTISFLETGKRHFTRCLPNRKLEFPEFSWQHNAITIAMV